MPRHADVGLGSVATVEDDHLKAFPVRIDHDHGGQGTYLRRLPMGRTRRSIASSRAELAATTGPAAIPAAESNQPVVSASQAAG
jgi:hypothetical protein